MKTNCLITFTSLTALTVLLATGCRCAKTEACCQPVAAAAPAAPVTPGVAVPPPANPVTAPAAVTFPLRIKAGQESPVTDSNGNLWLGERGFDGGDVMDRGTDVVIEGTKDPQLYRSEHYSMNAFSQAVPNGKYVVKLHFCETYDGIEGPGQRVFSFNVGGHEVKDFDVWVKAGGPRKPYVETVNVEVTNGKLDITFTSNIENPQINAIEIIPAT